MNYKKEIFHIFWIQHKLLGCIGDFDFADTKCDFMSFNGSKWLCGPMGTGVFTVNENQVIFWNHQCWR